MKVLIIRFSSIGDIVLTTPVIRCLKQQLPGITIHYLTKQSFKDVLIANPYIDQLHFISDDLSSVGEILKKENFDLVIDLHNNLRSLRIKKILGVKSASFNKLNLSKWLLVNFKINLMPDKSIVERYMHTVKPLGVHHDGKGLDYFIPKDVQVSNHDIPMSHWAGFVGCVIGGSYNTKKLPAEQWKKFCEMVPYPIVLLGGPEDKALGDTIAALDKIRIYNSCGKFSLNESACLVGFAKVIVSNDTGLMHIAAAFQKPIISLWGNTTPVMGMFPYYGYNNLKERVAALSEIMENKKLYCHPCSKLGYNKCPEKHFKCMNDLDMHKAAGYVKNFWVYPIQA